MGYEDLSVKKPTKWVNLGGKTREGTKNPTKIEGHYLYQYTSPNKFNPGQDRTTIVLDSPTEGVVGVNCNGFLANELRKQAEGFTRKYNRSPVGAAMLIEFAGEKDSGKGFPMKTFRLNFDAENTIEVTGVPADADSEDDSVGFSGNELDLDDSPEVVPHLPTGAKPLVAAAKASGASLKVQELLAKRSKSK